MDEKIVKLRERGPLTLPLVSNDMKHPQPKGGKLRYPAPAIQGSSSDLVYVKGFDKFFY